MHELSLVAELIDEVEQRAAGRSVALVVVRHATTISEETLRQAFMMLAGRSLAAAQLVCEPFEITLNCAACGFAGPVDHDHLAGHITVCPRCGDITGDSDLAEMELVSVVTE